MNLRMMMKEMGGNTRRLQERLHHLFRQIMILFKDFIENRGYYEDDEYIGLGRYRVASIKGSVALRYQSIFRFDNDHGAVVLKGNFAGDPWEVILIDFIRYRDGRCWYFETASESFYYATYDEVIAQLKAIKNQGCVTELDSFEEYASKVKESDRLYPLKWLQMVTASPANRRK